MDKLNEYTLVFKGLKDGKHNFSFKIEPSFFAEIEGSVIENGNFEVNIEMIKRPTMLQLDFDIVGKVQTICDNCLGELIVPVSYEGAMYVKFGAVYDEPSEEIIVLPHEENEMNVAHLIYEFIVVSLPLRNVHSNESDDDMCDDEMLDLLEQQNQHEEDTISTGDIDPRWEALKKLKENK